MMSLIASILAALLASADSTSPTPQMTCAETVKTAELTATTFFLHHLEVTTKKYGCGSMIGCLRLRLETDPIAREAARLNQTYIDQFGEWDESQHHAYIINNATKSQVMDLIAKADKCVETISQ